MSYRDRAVSLQFYPLKRCGQGLTGIQRLQEYVRHRSNVVGRLHPRQVYDEPVPPEPDLLVLVFTDIVRCVQSGRP